MSKRAGATSTNDKSESGSGTKRQRADWSPSQSDEDSEFSYTFTDQETLGLSANDMLKIAGRVVRDTCAEGQNGNVVQAIKHHDPHGDNAHNFLKSTTNYFLAHPLVGAAGGKKKRQRAHVHWSVTRNRMFGV